MPKPKAGKSHGRSKTFWLALAVGAAGTALQAAQVAIPAAAVGPTGVALATAIYVLRRMTTGPLAGCVPAEDSAP